VLRSLPARGCIYCVSNLSGSLAGAGGGSPTIRGAASMQQVAEWLEKLGLAQYAQRFAENDISFSVLPDLTDQHFKEIGVSLGHRLQLLRAIAELTSREKDTPKPTLPSAALAAPQDTAERRQVTVMFSDLVGSTALSARMDPNRRHLRVFGERLFLRRSVWVGFAGPNLSAKLSVRRVQKPESEPCAGRCGDSPMARKARPRAIRAAVCRERHWLCSPARPHGPTKRSGCR
jgi:SAM domain (Sterile alpha motif)